MKWKKKGWKKYRCSRKKENWRERNEERNKGKKVNRGDSKGENNG